MRILLWAEGFWPNVGGGPQFSAELAVALRDRGHEVFVITRHDDPVIPPDDSFHGVPVRRFPFRQALAQRSIDWLARLRHDVIEAKRRADADLIHTTSFGPSMLFQADTSRAHPAPLLVTLLGEENPTESACDTTLHRTLQAADWVTAPSEATLNYARTLVPSCAHRSCVVHLGVRRPQIEPGSYPTEPVLLCVGRLVRVKGYDLAVAALPTILEEFPTVRLIIAGDGPERDSLERQTHELGVEHAVDFLGWVSPGDVPALISTASAVLIPSRAEAFPLAGVQAAFMERPVIGASVGGIPELVLDRETGLLVKPESSAALAEAVLHLVNHPEERTQMGQAARDRALCLLDYDRMVDRYEDLYRRIVSARRHPQGKRIH